MGVSRSGTIHDFTTLAVLAQATHGAATASVRTWQGIQDPASGMRLSWTDAPSGTRYEIALDMTGSTAILYQTWTFAPDRCPADE